MNNNNNEILKKENQIKGTIEIKENSWIRELEWNEIPDYENEEEWKNYEDEP